MPPHQRITGSTNNDGTCTECPVGEYKSGSGEYLCDHEHNHVSSWLRLRAPLRGSDLIGAYYNDGACSLCPAGQFKSADGATACTDMDTNTCVAGQGFSSASASDQGALTGSTVNDGACALCTAGKYKSSSGARSCTAMTHTTCPPGQQQRRRGRSHVK